MLRIFDFDHLNKDQASIAANLLTRTYAFCKSSAFDWRRSSTMLSLVHEVFARDSTLTSVENDMSRSFAFFQTQLLKHAIESPPSSIKVFEQKDVEGIMDFMLERYYRHFKVYSYIFSTQVLLSLEQADRNDLELPRRPLPLQAGYCLA